MVVIVVLAFHVRPATSKARSMVRLALWPIQTKKPKATFRFARILVSSGGGPLIFAIRYTKGP